MDNWYLHSFTFNNEVISISELEITEGPTLIIEADYTLHGFGFCNNYNGEYEYETPGHFGVDDTFQPRNVTFGTNLCEGDLQVLETGFFSMFAEEKLADVYILDPSGNDKHIVLQFDTGYHEYKNYPSLSTQSLKMDDFALYPNPTRNSLNIQRASNESSAITIFDSNGRVLYSLKRFEDREIDISDFSPGVYFVTITSNEKRATKKFIKL